MEKVESFQGSGNTKSTDLLYNVNLAIQVSPLKLFY